MLQLDFRTYSRKFQPPLQTRHGCWRERQGLIIRLTNLDNPTQVGYGEVAPIPWFGTETLEEAIAFCQTLVAAPLEGSDFEPSSALMAQAPGSATQFGLGAAAMQLTVNFSRPTAFPAFPICTLLPTGEKAIQALQNLVAPTSSQPLPQNMTPALTPPQTFKWKIGVDELATEQVLLRRLFHALPAQARLRLDANGGLSRDSAQSWLRLCDELEIEFLEQPLPPEQFETMQALAEQYNTPIALDESVAHLEALKACYELGWRGIFVVKGAIAGHPQALLNFCAQHSLDLVFSSVFETGIARQAVWELARQLCFRSSGVGPFPQRALGFGVEQWLEADGLATANPHVIWEQL